MYLKHFVTVLYYISFLQEKKVVESRQLLQTGTSYCTYAPDETCYTSGWPTCCGDETVECPEEKPPCDVDYPPLLGSSYCTYAPNTTCYTISGWPACCEDETLECPEEQPPCDVDSPPLLGSSESSGESTVLKTYVYLSSAISAFYLLSNY